MVQLRLYASKVLVGISAGAECKKTWQKSLMDYNRGVARMFSFNDFGQSFWC